MARRVAASRDRQPLRFIRDNGIENVVWLTADVHYTAAHYYDPNQAQFQEFAPFWEFVSGPERRHLRPGAGQYLRAPGRVPEGAPGVESAAVRRVAVLRSGGHRGRERGHDRAAHGSERPTLFTQVLGAADQNVGAEYDLDDVAGSRSWL